MWSRQIFWLARRKFTLRYCHCADSNILRKILVRLFLKYDLSDGNSFHNRFIYVMKHRAFLQYKLSICFRCQSIMENKRFLHWDYGWDGLREREEIVLWLFCIILKDLWEQIFVRESNYENILHVHICYHLSWWSILSIFLFWKSDIHLILVHWCVESRWHQSGG
jgi:hypothetical protein